MAYSMMSEGFRTDNVDFSQSAMTGLKDSEIIPNIVIYDMPRRYAVEQNPCDWINKTAIFEDIPRIVISTSKKECSSCDLFKANKCAYLQKPFSLSNLSDMLKAILS